MAVVRLWAAGSEFRDLAALREARCGNGAPGPGLALDPAVAGLITDGIAVNSTAELRPSADGAHSVEQGRAANGAMKVCGRAGVANTLCCCVQAAPGPMQLARHAAPVA